VTKLSVVIIAQDEERTIANVLKSVMDIASEIILVDSGSTDRTIDIAKSHGAKVYHQDWLGYARQKNYALELATGDWILSLDADEIVSNELSNEIKQLLQSDMSDSNCLGYRIPRLLFIGNEPLKHGGFYPDAQLRLFKKGAGQFNDRLVHEAIKISSNGTIGFLKHDILHYGYIDIFDFEQTLDKYAKLSAQEDIKSGFSPLKISALNYFVHPVWTFVFRYIFKAGWLDGSLGIKANFIYSNYVRSKIIYLQEVVKKRNRT
jgi:glycosyltransferase involved in cell wall biosynthesis